MFFYFICIALTFIMLKLINKKYYFGNKIVTSITVLIYSCVFFAFLISKSITFNRLFSLLLGLISYFVIIFLSFISVKLRNTFFDLIKIILPIGLISFLVYYINSPMLDLIVFIIIFLLVFVKLLNVKLVYKEGIVQFEGYYLALVSFIIVIIAFFRNCPFIFSFTLEIKYICLTFLYLIILLTIGIFIGRKISFLKYSGWHLSFKNAFILIVFILLHIALTEEIFFRGLIFNYLLQIIPAYNMVLAFIFSVLIFGYAHMSNFGWKMFLLASISGIFYTLIYIQSNNLIYPVFLHATVDLTWLLFFAEKETF